MLSGININASSAPAPIPPVSPLTCPAKILATSLRHDGNIVLSIDAVVILVMSPLFIPLSQMKLKILFGNS